MKIPTGTLVMAMDGRKLQLLNNEGDTQRPQLRLLTSQEHEGPRSDDQGSDRPGRSFSRASPRRSAMSETDRQEKAEKKFAKQASQLLEDHQSKGDRAVIVLAAPAMLGEFRNHCTESLRRVILAEIDKDVVNHPPEKIASIIAASGD